MIRRRFIQQSLTLLGGGLLAACVRSNPTSNPAPAASETSKPTVEIPTATPAADVYQVQVLAKGLDFPEGPAFDPQGNLWCTELLGRTLVRWSKEGLQRYSTGGYANSMAFDRRGRIWMCDSEQNLIRRFSPNDEKWETMASEVDGAALQSPNDLAFDAQGNLIFTCPNFANTEPTGYVCCLKPNGTVKKIIEGLYRPNGLDFVDHGKFLVVGDTYQKKLLKGVWDDQGCAWQDPQPWAQVGGEEGPDGMAPGADGLLYVAIYGDGVVRVVDKDGKITQEYRLPGQTPTNVAIDPTGKLGIVVTETEHGQLLSLPGIKPGVAIFDGGEAWD
jgi:gluconolactonase